MFNFNVALLFLILSNLVYAEGANNSLNHVTNSGIINQTINNGISLEEHEKSLRKEIERVEAELKAEGNEKTKSLINKLSSLRKDLDKVLDEKNRLAKMVYEYRQKFSSLIESNNVIKNQSPEVISDFDLIAKSEDLRKKLLDEIKEKNDVSRMAVLLDILIKSTESMDDNERKYWRDLMSSMSFEQKYRLLEILSVERRKLADLERKYIKEIQDLNEKHLTEWRESEAKKIEEKGDEKEIELMNIKKITLSDATISDLRTAESSLKKLITLYPDYLDAYIYLMEVLDTYKEDRSYDAKIIMEKAKDIFKNSSQFNKELGYVYLKLDDKNKAYKYIKSAALEIDDNAKLHGIFGWLALENNDMQLAKGVLEKSYDKKKDDSQFVSTYSNLLDELGDNKKSIDVLMEFIKNNQPSSVILNALAWRYYKNEDYDNAFINFEKSYGVNKNKYQAIGMASLSIIEKKGNLTQAIQLMKNALDVFHTYTNQDKHEEGEMSLALAMLYSESEQLEKVIEYSNNGVNNTYGCSEAYMTKLNWHSKALAMLNKHRLTIGCP